MERNLIPADMNDFSPDLWSRLAEYVAGDGTPEDRTAVERWLQADARRADVVARMRAEWEARAVMQSRGDVDAAWASFLAQTGLSSRSIDGAITPTATPMGQRQAHRTSGAGQRIARAHAGRGSRRLAGWLAAAGILVCAIGLSHLPARKSPSASVPSVAAGSPREIRTRQGERATLDLADGTRVVLAPESRLRIPATYPIGNAPGARIVELDGEAYFSVKHDASRPFHVHTSTGVAEDLGTEFVVTAYPETRGTRVVVASGSVAMRNASNPKEAEALSPQLAVLRYGDLGLLDTSGAVTVRRGVDPTPYLAWKTGRLIFDRMPVRDALAVLRRWYDVDIRLGDASLAARLIAATIDQESIHGMVERLALGLNARAEWRGRTVTLYAR